MCLDLEPCPVWNEQLRTARKRHKCNECGRTIEPRERYRHTYYVDQDRNVGSFAVCWICDVFLDIVEEICGESQRSNGGRLSESLSEHEEYWRCAVDTEEHGRAFAGPLGDMIENDEYLYGPGLWDLWSACTYPEETSNG